MEAKRTVSLAATGRGEAQIGLGWRRVKLAAAPVAAPLPMRMNCRRVQEFECIEASLLSECKIDQAELSHRSTRSTARLRKNLTAKDAKNIMRAMT
jgi:hypothetical protein